MPKMPKPFDELTIADDFIFCLILRDKQVCTELLEASIGSSIGHIKDIHYQLTLDEALMAKSVRFDVLVKDNNNRLFDVEMQVANEQNLPLRMRYYSSILDVSFLDKGQNYTALPETYIIFFCDFIPFKTGKKLTKNTFKMTSQEDKSLILNNKQTAIVISTKAAIASENENLEDFLRLIRNKKPCTKFGKMVQSKVEDIKQSEKYRRKYRTMIETPVITDMKIAARKAGLAEGRAEGAYQKAVETAINAKNLGIKVEQIAKITGLSIQEIEKL